VAITAAYWEMDPAKAFSLKPKPSLMATSLGRNFVNTNLNA
jgi:hypothetical protein